MKVTSKTEVELSAIETLIAGILSILIQVLFLKRS